MSSIVKSRGDYDFIVFLNKDKDIISLQLGPDIIKLYKLDDSIFPPAPPEGAVYYVHVSKIYGTLSYEVNDLKAPRKIKEYEVYSKMYMEDMVNKQIPKPIQELYPSIDVPIPKTPVSTKQRGQCPNFIPIQAHLADKVLQCEYCVYTITCHRRFLDRSCEVE